VQTPRRLFEHLTFIIAQLDAQERAGAQQIELAKRQSDVTAALQSDLATLRREWRTWQAACDSSRGAAQEEVLRLCSDITVLLRDLAKKASEASVRAETIDRAAASLHHHAAAIADVQRKVSQHALLFPSSVWHVDSARRARGILRLLQPCAAKGVAKLRLGRDHDGGYVMLDAFDGVTTAFSLGISDDVSWDLAIAERGIDVLQFDPTVSGPPAEHPRFRFEPLRIAPCDGGVHISLESILRTKAPEGDGLILKIDIEGAEWDVFAALPDAALTRFRQIVCEFHTLDRLGEAEFGDRAQEVFAKLARTHFVCHVHGNNCGNFANVANVMVPQSLEVCFASRRHFTPMETDAVFPTPLDQPNEPGRADLYLGRFRFEEPDWHNGAHRD
jgi:hypothetical protein